MPDTLYLERLVCGRCGADYRRYIDPRVYFIRTPRERPAPDPTRCTAQLTVHGFAGTPQRPVTCHALLLHRA